MTPTLAGRLQTRLFLLATVGVAWTVIVVPFLALLVDPGVGDVYATAFLAVFGVTLLGMGWELVYHGLQQYRWEKDWPALFGLLTGANEFVTLVVFLAVLDRTVDVAVFLHFTTLWLLIWVVANGPMRVVFLRWRFHGGRIV